MTQLDDTDLLLSAALRSDIDVGEACVVDAQGRAFMFTGKNVFWCCIVWGFEYLPLGDGTIVEVINVESTDSTMVTVRVLDSPGKPELVNLIGTVQKSFLHRAVDHEAREEDIPLPYEHASHRHKQHHTDPRADTVLDVSGLKRALSPRSNRRKSKGTSDQRSNERSSTRRSKNRTSGNRRRAAPVPSAPDDQSSTSDGSLDGNTAPAALLGGAQSASNLDLTEPAMTRAYSDSLLDSAINTSDGKTVDPRMPSDQSPVISPNSDGAHPEDSWSPQHVRGQHMNRASEPQLGALLDEAGLIGDGSPRDGKARHGSYHHHHHHHGHSHPAGSARRHHHRHPAPIPVDGEKLLPPVSCPLFLPNGHVHRSHINELVPLFEASRVNYTDFYSLACQPVSRSMKGDLVRQLAELVTSQRFAKLRFLTGLREALVDITQHPNGVIAFSFDFKGKKTLEVITPSNDKYIIESGLADEPYRVHPQNVVTPVKTEARTFFVKDKIRFHCSPNGILRVESGDITFKYKPLVYLNADIRTHHNLRRIETDSRKRSYVRLGADKKPLIVDGCYVPHDYEDWLVITVMKIETWIGLPSLSHVRNDS